MYKYEMDPESIVENTERTRFYPQTHRRADGQMDIRTDKVKPVYPHYEFRWSGGYKKFNYNNIRCWLHLIT